MGINSTDWQLFLDESGNFSEPGARVVVAGLLLRHPPSQNLEKFLGEELARVYPFYPEASYPPHASHLNIPASRIAYAALLKKAKKEGALRFLTRCAAALAVLRESDDPTVRAIKEAFQRQKMPGIGDIKFLDAWLGQSAPEIRAGLEQMRTEEGHGLFVLFEYLLRAFGEGGCFLVAASEPRHPPTYAKDRYLCLAEALFERVFSVLRGPGSERHQVWVHVESRTVLDPKLKIELPLRKQSLQQVIEAAERFPLLAPASQRPGTQQVQLIAHQPQKKKNPQLHPGLILADLISNLLREALSREREWKGVKSRAAGELALPLETAARAFPRLGALPTLAVEGNPRAAIQSAFLGLPSPALDNNARPLWAHQQAEPWIAAAKTLGGEG